jgi:mannan endo-1,4-beta-mannosidase
MQAYKNYIKKILTRVNTINGRKYSEDPNILSLELVNEARTTDNYEINRGIKPGTLIKNWYREMTTYIRTLDKNHMVGRGFKSLGRHPFVSTLFLEIDCVHILTWIN